MVKVLEALKYALGSRLRLYAFLSHMTPWNQIEASTTQRIHRSGF